MASLFPHNCRYKRSSQQLHPLQHRFNVPFILYICILISSVVPSLLIEGFVASTSSTMSSSSSLSMISSSTCRSDRKCVVVPPVLMTSSAARRIPPQQHHHPLALAKIVPLQCAAFTYMISSVGHTMQQLAKQAQRETINMNNNSSRKRFTMTEYTNVETKKVKHAQSPSEDEDQLTDEMMSFDLFTDESPMSSSLDALNVSLSFMEPRKTSNMAKRCG